MSATDELRQLLDEHGIEWWSDGDISSDHTEWTTDSMAFTSLGMDGDKLAIKTITMMTPRQAFDVTLGRVIRDDTLRRESDARMALQCDYNNQCKRIHNQRKQLAEMQAARGTCHIVETEHWREIPCDLPDTNWQGNICCAEVTYDCDECGYENRDYNVRYCGGCGRRVVWEGEWYE